MTASRRDGTSNASITRTNDLAPVTVMTGRSGRLTVLEALLNYLGWSGIVVALVVFFLSFEFIMRAMMNRNTSVANDYPHRMGTHLPRAT